MKEWEKTEIEEGRPDWKTALSAALSGGLTVRPGMILLQTSCMKAQRITRPFTGFLITFRLPLIILRAARWESYTTA